MTTCLRRFEWFRTAAIASLGLFVASESFAEPNLRVTGGAPTLEEASLKFAALQTAPVAIKSFSPQSANLSLSPGESVQFGVTVTPAPGTALTYVWRLNGQVDPVAKVSTFDLLAGAAGSTATVAVTVSDGFTTASQEWTVTVESATGLPTPKAGDGTASIGIGDQLTKILGGVKPGQEIEIPIEFNQEIKASTGFGVALTFDPGKLSVVRGVKAGVYSGALDLPAQVKDSTLSYGAAFFGQNATATGPVAVLTFKTAADFSGTTEIELTSLSIKISGGGTNFSPGATVVLTSEALGPPGIPSDFDGNGTVDFDDFFAFAGAFGKKTGEEGFEDKFDLVKSGEIDFDDFFTFAADFGKTL